MNITRVKNYSCCIVHLNWDNSGVQLLVASEDGQVEVFGMLDDLLNKWKLLYSGQFPGEPILASCWLSSARQVFSFTFQMSKFPHIQIQL